MKNRRKFLISSLAAGIGLNFPRIAFNATEPVSVQANTLQRIAFGSCCKSWKPQDIWADLIQVRPDLFLFIGDVVYADEKVTGESGIIHALAKAYSHFSAVKEFQRFRERIPILATWDDHDYGPRESGADFGQKAASRKLFLDFWRVPTTDPRRNQPGGIYAVREYGPPGRRVQIILLDTRFGRTPLIELPEEEFERVRISGFGPYQSNKDPKARLLHDAQWTWLEKQLRRPAQLRLICSSIPFAAGFRGWESWANFPLERLRFIRLIEKTGANGVVFLSGDIHYGDLSRETQDVPYPIWDLTSSGLTHFWPAPGPNANRAYPQTVHARNFGLVHIRWNIDNPLIVLEIRGVDQKIRLQHTLQLNALQVS